MKTLIAEDDLASRIFMQKFLSKYGDCDIAVDGLETINAYLAAFKDGKPYDLICLDIMMPKLDGLKVLKSIRDFEKQNGVEGDNQVKVIMTTALNDKQSIKSATDLGCASYEWKPIDIEKFILVLRRLDLVN